MSKKKSMEPAFQGITEGIFALFCIQIFSTLSFSVLYSTLVLYMTGPLAMTVQNANSIMGIFVAFNFALHLLGGYWGGRFFSNRMLFSIGMLAQIVGCVLLSKVSIEYLYYGLAAFLTGCGLNVTCINCMLTQRFNPEDSRREDAFLYNYAGMNIGFFVGFSLSGYFQLSQNYHRLFLLSSLGNLIALLVCLYYWQTLEDRNTVYVKETQQQQKRLFRAGLLRLGLLFIILGPLLHFAELASKLVLLVGISMIIVIFSIARSQKTVEARNKIFAFIILMLVSVVFWTLFQIGPMGLTYFIEHNVNRNFGLMTIPPQWFQNINTVCIVFGGPLVSYILNRLRAKKVAVNVPVQFATALSLIGLAFVILPIGICYANQDFLVAPAWIASSFILQSVGELLLSPIGYAMVGRLAPASLQGVMMGMWMLSSGIGATLSSYSSNWMIAGLQSNAPQLTNSGYSHVFLLLGFLAIASGITLFLIAPLLKKWMYNNATPIQAKNDLLAI